MKIAIAWLGAAMAFLAFPVAAQAASAVPQFQVDPFWPKPLPNNWILGQVSGIATDKYDRIWVVHRPGSLTPRERKVMERVVLGMLNKQIADELQRTEKTIKVHRSYIMQKMRASPLAELVRMAESWESRGKRNTLSTRRCPGARFDRPGADHRPGLSLPGLADLPVVA